MLRANSHWARLGLRLAEYWGHLVRSTYRNLAYTIAGLVVVQAGAIAWGFFGLSQ